MQAKGVLQRCPRRKMAKRDDLCRHGLVQEVAGLRIPTRQASVALFRNAEALGASGRALPSNTQQHLSDNCEGPASERDVIAEDSDDEHKRQSGHGISQH